MWDPERTELQELLEIEPVNWKIQPNSKESVYKKDQIANSN